VSSFAREQLEKIRVALDDLQIIINNHVQPMAFS
jgi:hypothetical protein